MKKPSFFCRETVKRFADCENGGFYLSQADSTELFMNPKESYDGAIPSGNSVMAYNFVRLFQLTDKEEYKELAEKQIAFMSAQAQGYPAGYSMFLTAKLLCEAPPQHITIIIKNSSDLKEIRESLPFLTNISIKCESKEFPLLNNQTTYYICKNHNCLPPTNTI